MLSLANPIYQNDQVIGYSDHRNEAIRYTLPVDTTAANDLPPLKIFYFASEAQGARLNLHLQLVYLDHDPDHAPDHTPSPLPITDAWIQLHCALPLLADTDGSEKVEENYSSQWLPISLEQNRLNGLALELDITTTRVLYQLLTQEDALPVDSIRVDVRLNFEGLRASFDQSLNFQPIEFFQHCQQLIAYWQQNLNPEQDPDFVPPAISAALALNFIKDWQENSTTLEWFYTDQEDTLKDAQREELSLRLLAQGWQVDTQAGYQLRPLHQWQDLPDLGDTVDAYDNASIHWNLQKPCKDTNQWLGQWSLSQYWLSLNEQQRQDIITSAPVFDPFSAVPIELSSLIPLNATDITKLIAKVHYYSEDRQWRTEDISWQYSATSNTTNPQENTTPISQQIWGLVPQGDDFHCYTHYELWFGIPPDGGWPLPPVRTSQQRLDSPYILLTPETLGLEFIRIEIQADAWSDDITSIEVRLLSEQIAALNTQQQAINFQPSVYNTTSSHLIRVDQTGSRFPHYSHYQLILHPANDQIAAITQDIQPLPAERLLITSFHTQVISPTQINVSVDDSIWQNTETIILRLIPASDFNPEATTLDDMSDIRLLDPQSSSRRWLFWPSSRFNPNAFYWRADIVVLDGTERVTHAISWQFCQESQLTLNSTLLALPSTVTDSSTGLLTP